MSYTIPASGSCLIAILLSAIVFTADAQEPDRQRRQRVDREASLKQPYAGTFFNGQNHKNLFPIKQTGVSTEPIRTSVNTFLAALTDTQRKDTTFAADDLEWRKWDNRHSYQRQGISFQEMTEKQRQLAFGFMKTALSARGLQQSQNVMKLNGTLEELTNREGFGEWNYYLTVMGTPSATEPWGWQLDGHHLVINYFILGDQVVMSPVFLGSEPVIATSGKFKGAQVCQEEQDQGLAFIQRLTKAQHAIAIVEKEKGPTNNTGESFRDNQKLNLVGIRASELDAKQQAALLALIKLYVGKMNDDHARVKMSEVNTHLSDTYFAWKGGIASDSVYYYRIQSPVILIEFDHQRPIALDRSGVPTRQHIHTVVRTPNGNDYGKDLLRQHLDKHH